MQPSKKKWLLGGLAVILVAAAVGVAAAALTLGAYRKMEETTAAQQTEATNAEENAATDNRPAPAAAGMEALKNCEAWSLPAAGSTRAYAVEDEIVTNLAQGALQGKKIACIGDSITAGAGGADKPEGGKKSYCDYLAEYSGAEVVNLGIGGAPLGGHPGENGHAGQLVVNRYLNIPQDTDIIILLAGINDYLIGEDDFGTMGTKTPGTYCGDVARLFDGLETNYPDAEVWVVTPYDTAYVHEGEKGRKYPFETWVYVQLSLAMEHDFHIIDLFHEKFMNNNFPDIADTVFADTLHPNDLGYRLLARHFMARLAMEP